MKTSCLIRNIILVGIGSLALASCGGGGGGGGGESSPSGNDTTTNTPSTQSGYAPYNLSGCKMTYTYNGKPYTFTFDDSGKVSGVLENGSFTTNYDGTYTYSRSADGRSASLMMKTASGTSSQGISYTQTFDVKLAFSSATQATAQVSYTNNDSYNGNEFFEDNHDYSVTVTFSGAGVQDSDSSEGESNDDTTSDDSTQLAPESLSQKILTIKDSPVLEQGESFIFLSDTSALYGGQIKATYSYTKDANIPNKGFLESTINYGGYTYIHKFTITFLSDTEVTISGKYSEGSDTRYYTDNAGTLTTGNASPDSSGGESNDSSSDNTGNDTEESHVGTAPDSLEGYVIHAQTYSRVTRRYYITGKDEAYIKASYTNKMTGYYSGEEYIFSSMMHYKPSEDRKTAKLSINTPSQWIGSTYPYGGQIAGYQQDSTTLSATLYFDDEGNIYKMEGTLDYEELDPGESVGVNAAQ